MEFYLKAAHDGNCFSQIKIGEIYCTSDIIEEDFEEAEFWFKKALEGFRLTEKFVKIGEQLSEKWFVRSAGENGGYVHERHLEKAFYWYKKAAELGDPDGMYYLAESYEKGSGVALDLHKSFHWYKEALSNNCSKDTSARMSLAKFCEEGVVCDKRIDIAISFYDEVLEIYNDEIASYKGEIHYYEDSLRINHLNTLVNEINEKKKKIDTNPKKTYLFFDVETTGVPKNWKAPITDSENWPVTAAGGYCADWRVIKQ